MRRYKPALFIKKQLEKLAGVRRKLCFPKTLLLLLEDTPLPAYFLPVGVCVCVLLKAC